MYRIHNTPKVNAIISAHAAFEQFTHDCKNALRRIARASRGEHVATDIIAEAWIMAYEWQHKRGRALNLRDAADQDLRLSHLYQHLIGYTDKKVRNGGRLDHAPEDGEMAGQAHPLMMILCDASTPDPLSALLQYEEEARLNERLPDCHHSIASAYVHLLSHFNNHMPSVAAHLLISVSWSYRCCARARALAQRQWPTPLRLGAAGDFLPGAWRKFRLHRPPEQLTLDFHTSSLLPEADSAPQERRHSHSIVNKHTKPFSDNNLQELSGSVP